jgi:hypothetical protein
MDELEDKIQLVVQEQIRGLKFLNEMLKHAFKWGVEQIKEWKQGNE